MRVSCAVMTDVLMIDDLVRSLDRFGIKAGIDLDGPPADRVTAQPDMIHLAGPGPGGACPGRRSPRAFRRRGCCSRRGPLPPPRRSPPASRSRDWHLVRNPCGEPAGDMARLAAPPDRLGALSRHRSICAIS